MNELLAGIEGIIFDCDGTLTDSMPVHFRSWSQTFANHGIPFDQQRFYSLGGMPSDRIIAMISEEHGKSLDATLVSREKEEHFLSFLSEVGPVEKVVALALEEKGKRKLAVASGGFRWVIDRQLAHLGFATDHFDAIVTAEDTERHKPHPDVFLEAARQMNVEASKCLVFEDAELGIEAARRAGMRCVDVRTDGWGSSSV